MKKIMNKVQLAFLRAKLSAASFISQERGDTNFISIAIILVVVLAVAVAFIAFKDEILEKLGAAKDALFGALDGQRTTI